MEMEGAENRPEIMNKCRGLHLKGYVSELERIGCCDLCILRYLGVKDSYIYKEPNKLIEQFLRDDLPIVDSKESGNDNADFESDSNVAVKRRRVSICTACLGLLQQEGSEKGLLDQIVSEIHENGIEALSYCPALSLPICMQVRAYAIWFHLEMKFGTAFPLDQTEKPDGAIGLKNVWKWIHSDYLKKQVNPKSDWGIDGDVKVEIFVEYDKDQAECEPLRRHIAGIKRKDSKAIVTRMGVESHLRHMNWKDYIENFECPPRTPSSRIYLSSIKCSHQPIYIAGRYCKYSRKLSQTPWIIDSVRKTESSVEELMSSHIIPLFKASECRFSSSGREDVDVRTLGKGRPFVFEVLNPKRTIFTLSNLKTLQEAINSSTRLISVRDLQITHKKDLEKLKHGEESKSKLYCALCYLPQKLISDDQLILLNDYPLPITLKQKTPVRVLHRRSLATRERQILEMRAERATNSHEMFKLFVRTDAGTYVKEFVHGDFGRTEPNIGSILGVDADILALDVLEVALDWPPSLNS